MRRVCVCVKLYSSMASLLQRLRKQNARSEVSTPGDLRMICSVMNWYIPCSFYILLRLGKVWRKILRQVYPNHNRTNEAFTVDCSLVITIPCIHAPWSPAGNIKLSWGLVVLELGHYSTTLTSIMFSMIWPSNGTDGTCQSWYNENVCMSESPLYEGA